MSDTMHDERGQAVETFTATAAKNAFGTVLEKALSRGVVAITKRKACAPSCFRRRGTRRCGTARRRPSRGSSRSSVTWWRRCSRRRRARPATRSSPRSPPRSGGPRRGPPASVPDAPPRRASWSSPGPTAPARAASVAPSCAGRRSVLQSRRDRAQAPRRRPGSRRGGGEQSCLGYGKRLLEEAIRDRPDFAFETTLGGTTITTCSSTRAGRASRSACGMPASPLPSCTSPASPRGCAAAATTSRSATSVAAMTRAGGI